MHAPTSTSARPSDKAAERKALECNTGTGEGSRTGALSGILRFTAMAAPPLALPTIWTTSPSSPCTNDDDDAAEGDDETLLLLLSGALPA